MEDKMVVTALTAKIWSEQSTFLKQLVKDGVIDDKTFIAKQLGWSVSWMTNFKNDSGKIKYSQDRLNTLNAWLLKYMETYDALYNEE